MIHVGIELMHINEFVLAGSVQSRVTGFEIEAKIRIQGQTDFLE